VGLRAKGNGLGVEGGPCVGLGLRVRVGSGRAFRGSRRGTEGAGRVGKEKFDGKCQEEGVIQDRRGDIMRPSISRGESASSTGDTEAMYLGDQDTRSSSNTQGKHCISIKQKTPEESPLFPYPLILTSSSLQSSRFLGSTPYSRETIPDPCTQPPIPYSADCA
jgi:hypothetical protein